MAVLLLRLLRRRSSLEERDVATVLDMEFRRPDGSFDLRPSVYEVSPGEVGSVATRLVSEHAASFLSNPPRLVPTANMARAEWPTIATPGLSKFEFSRQRHREIVCQDDADLKRLVSGLWADEPGRGCPRIRGRQIVDYANGRLGMGDPEWAALSPHLSEHWRKRLNP